MKLFKWIILQKRALNHFEKTWYKSLCKTLLTYHLKSWANSFRILLVKHVSAFGRHDKHCLTSTFCLSKFQKHFLLVGSKKCLSSKCLCDGQTVKHCAWQTKRQMLAKQCFFIWPGLRISTNHLKKCTKLLNPSHAKLFCTHTPCQGVETTPSVF